MNINLLKFSIHLLLASIMVVPVVTSCYKVGDAIAPNKVFAADSVTEKNVSYENYIYPILNKNCSTCHGPTGSAKEWWLNEQTYENAFKYAEPITRTMINGTMPPPPKFPFSERDRALLKAWIDRGMPKK